MMLRQWIQSRCPSGITRKMLQPIFLFGTLAILLSMGVIVLLVRHFLFEAMQEQTSNQLRQIVGLFDEQMEELDTAVLSADGQLGVKGVINGSYDGYQEFTYSREAYSHVMMVNSINPRVNLYVFVPSRHYVMGSRYGNVSSRFDIETAETTRHWYQEILPEFGTLYRRSDFVAPVTGGARCFASILKVNSVNGWDVRGVIVAALDNSFLHSLTENTLFDQEGVLLAFNEDGSVAYASDGTPERYSGLLDENGRIGGAWGRTHFVSRMDAAPFRFAALVRKDNLYRDMAGLFLLPTLILLAVLAAVLMLSYALANRITRPIREMTDFVQGVESTQLTQRLEIHSNDEVQALANSFNAMLDSVQENQVLRREAQLSALQKQIDPHFLYNTLETVKGLAVLGDTRGVYDMLVALGDMLKYNANRSGQSATTVQEELDHVQNYLFIQKIRFKNRLEYEICADDSLRSCTTLRFVLQPIVENALHHGMESSMDVCRLRIAVSEEAGDRLRIAVTDNGPGIPEERLEALRAFIGGSGEQGSFGIGLKNIHQRLRLYFSDEYGLTIQSREGEYTRVSLLMPKRRG